MDEDIVPGESRYVAVVDAPDGWRFYHYSDEVFWACPEDEYCTELKHYRVVKFPFVPGYFLCRLVGNNTHYPVAGPFPTLKSAKAAVTVCGEVDDAEDCDD